MNFIYKYTKEQINFCCEEGIIIPFYNPFKSTILNIENNKLGNLKILEVPVHFDRNIKTDNFIKYLVHKTRLDLINDILRGYYPENININNIDFSNKCIRAFEDVKFICSRCSFENWPLIIYPGYMEEAELFNGTGYHYANIVKDNDKFYLVDVTYSQFFYAKQNNLNRIGIINLANCDVGTFALMDETRKKVAIALLKNGYIELDEEVFKAYLDSFTVSFRNGLYYENTNDFSYTTTYTVDDYIRFLQGKDNQINHEGRENLGYQKRPLQNWNLNFSRKMN